MPGPTLRTDIVDVYVFRGRTGRSVEFLQLRRSAGATLPGTWQPVMGHILEGETAAACAARELREETGYGAGAGVVTGFWQLESPNVYFMHAAECMMMSPCFAVRVEPGREPVLNPEHDAARWIRRDYADCAFLWPGQRQAIGQVIRDLLEPGAASGQLSVGREQ